MVSVLLVQYRQTIPRAKPSSYFSEIPLVNPNTTPVQFGHLNHPFIHVKQNLTMHTVRVSSDGVSADQMSIFSLIFTDF